MDISAASSLVIVPSALASVMVMPIGKLSLVIVKMKVSSGSTTASSMVWTVIVVVVPETGLAGKDTVPVVVAKSSAEVGLSIRPAISQLRLIASEDVACSVRTNATFSPSSTASASAMVIPVSCVSAGGGGESTK